MVAAKGNKVYDIDEREADVYAAQGFDILDDKGGVVMHAKNKVVPYSEYEKVIKELEALKKAKKAKE